MTATVVNSVQGNVGTGTALTLGFTPTVGNTLLVYVWEEGTNVNTECIDSAGNPYARDYNIAPTGNGQSVYRLSNIALIPTTITIVGGTAGNHMAVVEVSGLSNSSPLSQAVSRTDGNPTSHSYALTTTTDNEFIFMGAGFGGNPGTLTGTGISTILSHVVYAREAGYITDAGTAGSHPFTYTTSNGIDSYAVLAAYKTAASGPTVSTVSSNSATEGSSIVHTVTLSAAVTGSAASYAITLAGGTATGGGTDYTSTLSNGMFSDSVTVSGGNISVPVGVSTFTVTVSTAGDTIDEANETYTLTIGGTAGTGTINDDDAAPTITGTTSSTVTAGDPVVITYSPGLSGQTRTYTLAFTDGTAVGGTDYDNTIVSGDFAVTAGTGSVSISGSTVTVDAGVTEFTLSIGTTD